MDIKDNPLSSGVFERNDYKDVIKKIHQDAAEDIETTESERQPYHFRIKSSMNICLHPLSYSFEDFRMIVMNVVMDKEMLQELTVRNVMNWCRTSKPLLPIKTAGDGNCLLHAISIFLWGIQDSNMLLRRLLCIVLGNDTIGIFKERWQKERGYVADNVPAANVNSVGWNEEWEIVVKQVDDNRDTTLNQLPYRFLEEIHVFIMANILRRPIIILCDPMLRSPFGLSMQENNFGGIYLPLLWDSKDCFKYPIVLGYSNSHFCPLVSQRGQIESVTVLSAEHVIPLVEYDQRPLRLHFLLDHEEPRATSMLSQYLLITEVVHTTSGSVNNILAAKLNTQPIPDETNIVKQFFQALERSFIQERLPSIDALPMPSSPLRPNIESAQGNHNVNAPLPNSESIKCLTPGCKMNATFEMNYLCSRCFAEFSKHDAQQEMMQRKQHVKKEQKSQSPLILVEPLDEKKMLPAENHSLSEIPKALLYTCTKSLLLTECVGPYCQNQVAKDSKLCDECLTKLKLINKPNTPHSDYELFGTGKCEKTEAYVGKAMKEIAVQTSPCKTEGCEKNGKESQENMCPKCYLLSGNFTSPVRQNAHVVTARSKDTKETQENPIVLEAIASPQSQKTQPESWSDAEVKKYLCATPGCNGLRLTNPQGICHSCLDSMVRRTVVKQTKSSHEAVSEWLQSQPSPPESLPEGYDSQLVESRAPSVPNQNGTSQHQTCASPMCSNEIVPPKQLCDPCLNLLSSAKAKQGVCPTEGCQFHGATEFDGYCSKCFNSLERKQVPKAEVKSKNKPTPKAPANHVNLPQHHVNLPPQSAYTAPLFSKGRPCLTPSCSRYGDISMEGLCTRCYQQKFSSQSAYQTRMAMPPSTGLYQMSTFTKPIQQVARIPPDEGNRTGLVISGSGPTHFRPSGRSQLVTSEGNDFEKRMLQLEELRKSNKCINVFHGCKNFGSKVRQGYCSRCYDLLRGEDVVDGNILA